MSQQNQVWWENSINLMQMASPIPSDPSYPTYNAKNRDAQADYAAYGIKESCKTY